MFLEARSDVRGSREGGKRLVAVGDVDVVEVVESGREWWPVDQTALCLPLSSQKQLTSHFVN